MQEAYIFGVARSVNRQPPVYAFFYFFFFFIVSRSHG